MSNYKELEKIIFEIPIDLKSKQPKVDRSNYDSWNTYFNFLTAQNTYKLHKIAEDIAQIKTDVEKIKTGKVTVEKPKTVKSKLVHNEFKMNWAITKERTKVIDLSGFLTLKITNRSNYDFLFFNLGNKRNSKTKTNIKRNETYNFPTNGKTPLTGKLFLYASSAGSTIVKIEGQKLV